MDLNVLWDEEKYADFILYLKSISEIEYKKFHAKLTSTKYEILGIRLPILRNIAKEITKGNYKSFLKLCGSNYYEEVMIKGLVIASINDIDELMLYFNSYVLLIDNWAICDTFCNSLKLVSKNKECFMNIINNLLKSNNIFKIRVGLVLLLNYYIEEDYLEYLFKIIENIKSEEYYVNMARAWLLCEMFIKYENITLKYLENNSLDKFTINKTISKIRDSYRVSKEMKEYILKFKKE
ncbi:MAG: DNA alkylation repair protein [Firmicutes bacterium]|nr:DNA alkylation repair protein [Bacillota bacterium]